MTGPPTATNGSMREQLRAVLLALVPGFAGRVYQPSAPALSPRTLKPFAVVRVQTLAEAGEWESRRSNVVVWICAERGSYAGLDELGVEVERALDNLRVTDGQGRPYVLRYDGSTVSESEDAAYDGLVRSLGFVAERLDWIAPVGIAPDPVLGLADWTRARFPQAGTDPGSWDPRDATPGVYWRLDRGGSIGGPWDDPATLGWIAVTLRGHVIAQDADPRTNLCRRIASLLTIERTVVVGQGTLDETTLWVEEVSFDARADPYTDGQVTVRGRLPARIADDLPPTVPVGPMEVIHVAVDAAEDGTIDLRVTRPPEEAP